MPNKKNKQKSRSNQKSQIARSASMSMSKVIRPPPSTVMPSMSNTLLQQKDLRSRVQLVCGVTDPFCEHARGAKLPDTSSTRTLTIYNRKRVTFTSDANGTHHSLFNAQYYYDPIAYGATATGSVITSWQPIAVSGMPSVQNFRIISIGIRLNAISAPLYQSGMVSVRVWSQETLENYGTIDLASYLVTQAYDIPLSDCKDKVIILNRTSQRPETFHIAGGNAGTAESSTVTSCKTNGFTPVTIYLSGVPVSTAVLSVEYIINYEVLPLDSNEYATLATQAPPYDPILVNAATHVRSVFTNTLFNGVKAAGAAIESRAKAYLANAAKNVVAGLLM